MNESTPIEFNVVESELQALVQSTSGITATDLKDRKQLDIVKKNRIAIRDNRTLITKTGKELRDGANAYNAAVLKREKELLAIITPEEDRLKQIEEDAKQLVIIEERTKQLPERQSKLLAISSLVLATDEELLKMDDTQFEAFVNLKTAEKLQEEQARIDKEKSDLLERENALKHAEEIEQAKIEAAQKERERLEQQEIADKQKAEAEAIKEKELLEKRKVFTDYRSSLGYSEETKDEFYMIETPDSYVFYKKCGEFKK